MAYEKNMNYAGFWKRSAAAVIDWVILFISVTILHQVLIDSEFIIELLSEDFDAFLEFAIWLNIVAALTYWIYFAAFESCSKQATLGKMACGIKVTDLNGRRIGFGKATGRFFGKILSMVILLIGFIMIVFTEKKQGLHDKMAGCLVVNK